MEEKMLATRYFEDKIGVQSSKRVDFQIYFDNTLVKSKSSLFMTKNSFIGFGYKSVAILL